MELNFAQKKICEWYSDCGEKIKEQSRCYEIEESEQTNIYHNELHKKYIRKGHILKLETEYGLLLGHEQCASYLEGQVKELLGSPANLDSAPQQRLLSLVEVVLSENDNRDC